MVEGISWEEFFANYWRKKPLFVKGGAFQWLHKKYDLNDFNRMVQKVEKIDPNLIKRNENKVTFVQQIDLGDSHLQQLAINFKRLFSCPSVWFDSVQAVDNHGIGCHFDDSDNFVLQQQGVKIWKLHSPEIIPEDILRRRMLKQPIGNIYMPETYTQFVLEPGDLLYIPIFWPHWGVSVGATLSLSLVCNASNAIDEILPIINQLLKDYPAWWRPLSYIQQQKEMEKGLSHADSYDQIIDSLFQVLEKKTFRQQLKDLWKRQHEDRIYQQHQERISTNENLAKEIVTRAVHPPLQMDMDQVKEFYKNPIRSVDLGEWVTPGHCETHATLQTLKFRLALKRFLLICEKSYELMESENSRDTLQNILNRLLRLDESRLRQVLLRPEMFSFVWRLHEAIDFAFPPRIEEISHYLGSFLLSFFVEQEGFVEKILCCRSTEYTLQLWNQKVQIQTAKPLPQLLSICCKEDHLQIADPKESCNLLYTIPISLLHTSTTTPTQTASLQIKPMSSVDSILFSYDHDWWERFLPKKALDHAKQLSKSQWEDWEEEMREALSLLRINWIEGYDELLMNISCLKPLSQPTSMVLPAFRGLILLGKQTDSVKTARLLARELARTKFYDLQDLFLIIEEDMETNQLVKDLSSSIDSITDLLANLYELILLDRLSFKELEEDRQILFKHSQTILSMGNQLPLTAEGKQIWAGILEAFQKFGVSS
jgi:ribosomal protein L16 Arg81 hydroxylase